MCCGVAFGCCVAPGDCSFHSRPVAGLPTHSADSLTRSMQIRRRNPIPVPYGQKALCSCRSRIRLLLLDAVLAPCLKQPSIVADIPKHAHASVPSNKYMRTPLLMNLSNVTADIDPPPHTYMLMEQSLRASFGMSRSTKEFVRSPAFASVHLFGRLHFLHRPQCPAKSSPGTIMQLLVSPRPQRNRR